MYWKESPVYSNFAKTGARPLPPGLALPWPRRMVLRWRDGDYDWSLALYSAAALADHIASFSDG